jgi:hypothetical protein
MSLSIDLKKFDELYNKQLLPKEQILKELNITEYFYKKIIKEFNIRRKKRTCEFERIKNANKDFITVVKHLEEKKDIKEEKKEEKKPKTINTERLNTLKNIERRQKETTKDAEGEQSETEYNKAIKEAMNILKTTRKTLNDKEIF